MIDGDSAWIGIDMVRDKPTVQPGYLSAGENTRLRTRKCKQRNGTTIPPDFNPVAGFTNYFVGSGVYRNPNGDEVLLVAPAGEKFVVALADGKDPVQINYNGAIATTNGTFYAEFAQAFDKVLLMRFPIVTGEDLVWDGDSTTPHTFDITTLSTNGLNLIPAQSSATAFMDRLVRYTLGRTIPARDSIIVSDVLDYTSYDNVYQIFRVNSGESDYISSVTSYFRGSIVIWKNQSIHMATDNGTYPYSMSFRVLSQSLGSVGRFMPLDVGGDFIFLSKPNGFYRLSEVIQEQIVTLPLPISEKIQPVIDDINWDLTEQFGCSVKLNEYAYFGVARGSKARGLNCILVYDTQSQEWESAGDSWADPDFAFHRLHVTNYRDAKGSKVHRVFALDYTNSVIYLLYEGVSDELKSRGFGVPFMAQTRGYAGSVGYPGTIGSVTGNPMTFKKFGKLRLSIATYDANVKVTSITDGFNEETLIDTITKDRTKYYTHGVPSFDPNTGDASAPYREDYSIDDIDNVAIEDFEDLPLGDIAALPSTGPATGGDKQESIEAYLLRTMGRWQSIRVENNDGVCDLLGIAVESVPAEDTVRTLA